MYIENPTFQQLISGRYFSEAYDNGLTSRFNSRRLKHSLVYREDSSNPSFRMDLENSEYMYRLTLWESGNCHIEAVNIRTGEYVVEKDYQFSSPKEFFTEYPGSVNTLFPVGCGRSKR